LPLRPLIRFRLLPLPDATPFSRYAYFLMLIRQITMLDFTPFYCRHFAAPALRCHFSSFTRFRLTFSDYISYAIFATLFLSLISTLWYFFRCFHLRWCHADA
jgi:hypothetical protein